MRNYLVTTVTLFFLFSVEGRSQTMIHDAIVLRNLYDTAAKKLSKTSDSSIIKYSTILKFYLADTIKSTVGLNTDAVETRYSTNPFLSELIPEIGSTSLVTRLLGGPTSSIMNADVTKLADGIAKFLVKRTKEELSAAFFASFKEDLNSDKYTDLRILFPQTARLLNLIDERIYQFSGYLSELREVFILDLNNLSSSLLVAINLPKYKKYFDEHPGLKKVVNTGLFLTNLLVKNDSLRHVGKVIDSLPIKEYFSLQNKTAFDTTLNGSLKTIQLLSASLKSQDTTGQSSNTQRFWITTDSIFMVLNDPIALKIYLGLLYQEAQNKQIMFTGKRLTDILKNTSSFIDTFQASLVNFFTNLNAFEDYRGQYRNIERGLQKDSVKLYYYGLFNSSLSILENGISIVGQWDKDLETAIVGKIIPPIQDAGEVYMYVSQKKYGPAVLSVVKLYKDIFKDADGEERKTFRLAKLFSRLSTYGAFISEVAKAENSDEVASIIEKTVLPTGSSYVKKNSVFNVALQAYTGLYAGQQRQSTDTKSITTAGVYASLGIGASWGTRRMNSKGEKKNPSAISLFVSVIDLGPLVSYRFSNANDSLANDISIRVNQILSPGLHLVYGFPKVPISFGIGGNWTPLLTKVESNAINVLDIDKRPFRWQAFIAVDIPFLNFYNRTR